MGLIKKGDESGIADFSELIVTMKWTGESDFDLAALYEEKSGGHGLVYFGELGDPDDFPFIYMSGDEGGGDTGGEKEESLRITKLADMKYIWLIIWDYDAIQSGTAARFDAGGISFSVSDGENESREIELDLKNEGNAAIAATIDNSGHEVKIVNNGKIGTLEGLSSFQQLLGIIR